MNATYLAILDLAGERMRSGGWTMADVLAFSRQLQSRYERQYGPLRLS